MPADKLLLRPLLAGKLVFFLPLDKCLLEAKVLFNEDCALSRLILLLCRSLETLFVKGSI